jgi:hypothetical protein
VALDSNRLTLLDHAKILDPDGSVAQVVEILNQTNEMLQDAPAYASNAPMGHRTTFRSSLPTVDFTKINKGVVRSKGTTEQRTDSIGLLAGLSEVDSKMASIIGAGAFAQERKKQDDGFLEAFSQLVQTTLLYGDTKTNEASFDGLAPRLATLNNTSLTTSQVHSAGTVTNSDGTSIYVVDWGSRGAHLIFPPNSTAGLRVEDKGELRVTDAEGNPFMAYTTAYDWAIGLSVEDPRHIARLANIDLSDASSGGSSQGVLYDKLIDLLSLMPSRGGMNRVMYVHPRLYGAFRKQAMAKTNLALTMEQYLGGFEPHFDGIPVRRVEKISLTESTVS